MSTSFPSLFTPLRLGNIDLPNRILMAPLTRMRAGPGDIPTSLNAEYYRGNVPRPDSSLVKERQSAPRRKVIRPLQQRYPGLPRWVCGNQLRVVLARFRRKDRASDIEARTVRVAQSVTRREPAGAVGYPGRKAEPLGL